MEVEFLNLKFLVSTHDGGDYLSPSERIVSEESELFVRKDGLDQHKQRLLLFVPEGEIKLSVLGEFHDGVGC